MILGKLVGKGLVEHPGDILCQLLDEGLGSGGVEPSREACVWLPGGA